MICMICRFYICPRCGTFCARRTVFRVRWESEHSPMCANSDKRLIRPTLCVAFRRLFPKTAYTRSRQNLTVTQMHLFKKKKKHTIRDYHSSRKNLFSTPENHLLKNAWFVPRQSGYLANVQCVEAWCAMTAEFYSEYLKPGVTSRQKQLLYIMNPNKFR